MNQPWVGSMPLASGIPGYSAVPVFPAIFSSGEVQQKSAAVLIHVPTSDGSGEACHPSVADIPGGFGGYRYWMANTPYPKNACKLENPELFASHDGLFWEVPSGVRNPLVPAPAGDNRHYHSDPCLLHDRHQLLLYFRSSDEESRPRHETRKYGAIHQQPIRRVGGDEYLVAVYLTRV